MTQKLLSKTPVLVSAQLLKMLAEDNCTVFSVADVQHCLSTQEFRKDIVDIGIFHKGLDQAELQDVLARKRKALERLWEPRLRGQMPELPHLETVIRETERCLRQWRLM